ncbi:MAG: hypothetical protein AVDCRST_MAG70-926 [uncultured Thermomicrobiales bacterium]|uniref:Uncharacterized protein n=1 Tax=uncultured Thermomicrobiales bacterium TaxID=1645740 RepID=A0A6J4UJY3_9BACT|nr:MAG: hypothetical protein AVDCRST_MAG70-926 [uncultured Thermomicrobiales bacterium]
MGPPGDAWSRDGAVSLGKDDAAGEDAGVRRRLGKCSRRTA